jgi:hypothetical protein
MSTYPMRLLFAINLCIVLSACAEDPFRPLADALLHKDSQSASQTPVETCKKVAFNSGLDVDTAYARAMVG